MEKKRVYYLDIAKGLGVILMILGHVTDLSIPSRQFVTSFHMPLFFVISGVIIFITGETARDMQDIVKRKLKSIMLPYFVFSVLSLIVEMYCTGILKNGGTWAIFREHLFATVFLIGASVFWFLATLFFGELLFLGIFKKTSEPVCGAVVAALAVLAYLGHVGENHLQMIYGSLSWYPWLHLFLNAFLRAFFAAFFVAAGYYGSRLIEKIPDGLLWNLLSGVVLMALTLVVSQRNGVTDMNYMVYNNIFLYLLTSLCGSFGTLFLCRGLEKWSAAPPFQLVRYYGRNSLIVMMTHAPFYIMYFSARVTYAICYYFPLGQVFLCTTMVCGVLVLEVGVIEVINRFLPFLLGHFNNKNGS